MGKDNTADTAELKLDDRSLAEGLLLGRKLGVSLNALTGGDKRRNKTMTRAMNALDIGKLDESDYGLSWVLDPAETASYLLARHGETAPDLAAMWVKEQGRRSFYPRNTLALVALSTFSPGELLWLRRHGAAQGHALYGVDQYDRGATQYAIGDVITYKDLEHATLYLAHASITAAYHAAYREHLRGRCLGGDATAHAIEDVCGELPTLAHKAISDALHGGGGFFHTSESRWKEWADPAQWQALVAERETALRAEIHEAQERLDRVKQIRTILSDLNVPATTTACVTKMVEGATPPDGLPAPKKAAVAA